MEELYREMVHFFVHSVYNVNDREYPSQSLLPLKPRPPAKQCLVGGISKSEGSWLKGRRYNQVMFFFSFDNWAAANRDNINDLISVEF